MPWLYIIERHISRRYSILIHEYEYIYTYPPSLLPTESELGKDPVTSEAEIQNPNLS